ncbi:hypothetical protein RCL1_005402 [Eukaryota sp. TZLM3-RCL]
MTQHTLIAVEDILAQSPIYSPQDESPLQFDHIPIEFHSRFKSPLVSKLLEKAANTPLLNKSVDNVGTNSGDIAVTNSITSDTHSTNEDPPLDYIQQSENEEVEDENSCDSDTNSDTPNTQISVPNSVVTQFLTERGELDGSASPTVSFAPLSEEDVQITPIAKLRIKSLNQLLHCFENITSPASVTSKQLSPKEYVFSVHKFPSKWRNLLKAHNELVKIAVSYDSAEDILPSLDVLDSDDLLEEWMDQNLHQENELGLFSSNLAEYRHGAFRQLYRISMRIVMTTSLSDFLVSDSVVCKLCEASPVTCSVFLVFCRLFSLIELNSFFARTVINHSDSTFGRQLLATTLELRSDLLSSLELNINKSNHINFHCQLYADEIEDAVIRLSLLKPTYFLQLLTEMACKDWILLVSLGLNHCRELLLVPSLDQLSTCHECMLSLSKICNYFPCMEETQSLEESIVSDLEQSISLVVRFLSQVFAASSSPNFETVSSYGLSELLRIATTSLVKLPTTSIELEQMIMAFSLPLLGIISQDIKNYSPLKTLRPLLKPAPQDGKVFATTSISPVLENFIQIINELIALAPSYSVCFTLPALALPVSLMFAGVDDFERSLHYAELALRYQLTGLSNEQGNNQKTIQLTRQLFCVFVTVYTSNHKDLVFSLLSSMYMNSNRDRDSTSHLVSKHAFLKDDVQKYFQHCQTILPFAKLKESFDPLLLKSYEEMFLLQDCLDELSVLTVSNTILINKSWSKNTLSTIDKYLPQYLTVLENSLFFDDSNASIVNISRSLKHLLRSCRFLRSNMHEPMLTRFDRVYLISLLHVICTNLNTFSLSFPQSKRRNSSIQSLLKDFSQIYTDCWRRFCSFMLDTPCKEPLCLILDTCLDLRPLTISCVDPLVIRLYDVMNSLVYTEKEHFILQDISFLIEKSRIYADVTVLPSTDSSFFIKPLARIIAQIPCEELTFLVERHLGVFHSLKVLCQHCLDSDPVSVSIISAVMILWCSILNLSKLHSEQVLELYKKALFKSPTAYYDTYDFLLSKIPKTSILLESIKEFCISDMGFLLHLRSVYKNFIETMNVDSSYLRHYSLLFQAAGDFEMATDCFIRLLQLCVHSPGNSLDYSDHVSVFEAACECLCSAHKQSFKTPANWNQSWLECALTVVRLRPRLKFNHNGACQLMTCIVENCREKDNSCDGEHVLSLLQTMVTEVLTEVLDCVSCSGLQFLPLIELMQAMYIAKSTFNLLLSQNPHFNVLFSSYAEHLLKNNFHEKAAIHYMLVLVVSVIFASDDASTLSTSLHNFRKAFLRARNSTKSFYLLLKDVNDFLQKHLFFKTLTVFQTILLQELRRSEKLVLKKESVAQAVTVYSIYVVVLLLFYFFAPSYVFLTEFWMTRATFIIFGAFLLESIIFVASQFCVNWPSSPPLKRLQRKKFLENRSRHMKEVALCITTHNSESNITATVQAALKVFPAKNIFICDNGNSKQPTDNTYEVVKRLNSNVNYLWVPEGSKTIAIYYAIKYKVKQKYVLLIDDDVLLPPEFDVNIDLFDEETKGIAITINASNVVDIKGKRITVAMYQSLEYLCAGLAKLFQSRYGSALFCHGAIGAYERDTLIRVLNHHSAVFRGDDVLMGLILHELKCNYRIATCGVFTVSTTVPNHYFCSKLLKCKCPEASLLKQRVTSWDTAGFRLIFRIGKQLLFNWSDNTMILKPFIMYELYSVISDYIKLFFLWYILWKQPLPILFGLLFSYLLFTILLFGFNYYTLRHRPDLQFPPFVIATYPLYRLFLQLFRLWGLAYNLFIYTPFSRDTEVIGHRNDLPMPPPNEQDTHVTTVEKTFVEAKDSIEDLTVDLLRNFNSVQSRKFSQTLESCYRVIRLVLFNSDWILPSMNHKSVVLHQSTRPYEPISVLVNAVRYFVDLHSNSSYSLNVISTILSYSYSAPSLNNGRFKSRMSVNKFADLDMWSFLSDFLPFLKTGETLFSIIVPGYLDENKSIPALFQVDSQGIFVYSSTPTLPCLLAVPLATSTCLTSKNLFALIELNPFDKKIRILMDSTMDTMGPSVFAVVCLLRQFKDLEDFAISRFVRMDRTLSLDSCQHLARNFQHHHVECLKNSVSTGSSICNLPLFLTTVLQSSDQEHVARNGKLVLENINNSGKSLVVSIDTDDKYLELVSSS